MVTREQAEQRVLLKFWLHFATYVAVVSGLAALNYTRQPEKLWFLWVAGGWGSGVLLHAACAFFLPAKRELMIERTAARMERRGERRG